MPINPLKEKKYNHNFTNSFKTLLGVIASTFYKGSKQETISPLSSSTIIGSYSANDAWFTVLVNKFYFKEDSFRFKAVDLTRSICKTLQFHRC